MAMTITLHTGPFPRDRDEYAGVGPIVLFLTLFVTWNVYRRIRPRPLPKSLPGPKSYPLVGILPYVIQHWEDWPEETARLCKTYGRTWGGGVPNVPGLNGAFFFIFEEANVKHVLSDNFDNYEKGPAFRSLYGDLLGQGIFAADGGLWRMHRKLISNMFSKNLLRRTAEVTLSKLDDMAGLFNETIGENNQNATARIDLQDIFFRMTFDTTSFVSFGCELNSLQAKSGQHAFAVAFDEMQLLVTERFLDPLFGLKRFLQIGTRERRITVLKEILAHEASTIINSRRRSVEDGCPLGPDLLSRFFDHAKKTNQHPRDDELLSLVINIMLAGRDTTACALSWGFYELTRSPNAIRKIIEEVDRVCGKNEKDYSYDNICQLQYTHAVAMEVLRLHPSVPNDQKYAVNDDILPDGTVVTAGMAVVWLPLAMGRCENIWGKDALEFKPERFLDVKEPAQYKYTAFNAGPRMCLGKPLALMTIKMTMAYLLPKFDFEDSIGHSGSYRWALVRAMKGGFPVDISTKEDRAESC